MASTSSPHEFIAPKPSDSRAPCPALNALANHGYLPRDGKNIGVSQLISALRSVYGLSFPFAFALSAGGMYMSGHGMSLNLDDLRKHGIIEHDGSLVHRDLDETGGTMPTNIPDHTLIDDIIKASDGEIVTLENLIQVKQIREARAKINSSADYPSAFVAKVSRGELIFTTAIMGESDKGVSVERLKTWYGEERLPDGYVPRQTTGLLEMDPKVQAVSQELDALHAELAKERRDV